MRFVALAIGVSTAAFGLFLVVLGGFNISFAVRGTAETPALNLLFGMIFAGAGAGLVWVGLTFVRQG